MDLLKLTALELSAAIKRGDTTCLDAVNCVFNSIQKHKNLNAFITCDREYALKRAKEVQEQIDNGVYLSPLAGVPISVKDNISTKDFKTTCASRILENYMPCYDATVIQRLNEAGLIIIGKTNMDEFAMGSTGETSYFGCVKNPLCEEKVAGGSSSGSAVSVATAQAFLSLGSDTGGSVRQPAAHCGVFGFKPTYGAVSRYGLIAYASSLDQIGVFSKTAQDSAALLDIISGKDEFDSTTIPDKIAFNSLCEDIKGCKIAIPNKCLSGIQPHVEDAVISFADTLKKLGATVDFIELDIFDYAVAAYYIIASAQASSNLSRYDGVKFGRRAEDYSSLADMYLKTRSQGFGYEVKKRIMLGNFVLCEGYYDAYYKKALEVKSLIDAKFNEVFSKYDFILTPTAPTTAPPINGTKSVNLDTYLEDIFTVPVNLSGLPAASVPYGCDDDGMPIGVQIIGPKCQDNKVLGLAHAVQKSEVGR